MQGASCATVPEFRGRENEEAVAEGDIPNGRGVKIEV